MRLRVALAFLFSIACSGCLLTGMEKERGAEVRAALACGAAGAPIESFRSSVYAYARANCTACHGSQLRPFASPDIQSAYLEAKHYADFKDPSASIFLRKVADGHC